MIVELFVMSRNTLQTSKLGSATLDGLGNKFLREPVIKLAVLRAHDVSCFCSSSLFNEILLCLGLPHLRDEPVQTTLSDQRTHNLFHFCQSPHIFLAPLLKFFVTFITNFCTFYFKKPFAKLYNEPQTKHNILL
jgi:hypothetical protein